MSEQRFRAPTIMRGDEPITLAEQIVAWLINREGGSVSYTSNHLRRPASQIRHILWGDAAVHGTAQ